MFTSVNPTIEALAQAILFSSSDNKGEVLSKNYAPCDINSECLNRLYSEYMKFVSDSEAQIVDTVGDNWDCIDHFYDILQPIENQTEFDYVMTRNRTGCGFEDGDWNSIVSSILAKEAKKLPEINAVEGDDKKVYLY